MERVKRYLKKYTSFHVQIITGVLTYFFGN